MQSRPALYVVSFAVAVLGSVVMSMTPVTVTLALRFSDIDPLHKNDSFGWAIVLGYLIQLLFAPLAGLLSDASSFKWGMRKPWIMAGLLGSLLAAWALVSVTTVNATLVSWAFMSAFLALMMTPLFAVIGDQFPPHQHGLVSGLCGATPPMGILLGSWIVDALPGAPAAQFMVPIALGAALILQFFLLLQDKVRDAVQSAGLNLGGLVRSFRFSPADNPSFAWLLLVVLLVYVGAITLQSYMVYLLQDAIKVPAAEIAHWTFLSFLVANGMGCGFSVISGVVSDRIGRRKPFYALGIALMAAGLIVQGMSGSISPFFVGTLLAGIGYGLLNGLTWALAVETSGEREHIARNMGLVNMALVIPGLIVPLIAWLTNARDGYLAMYVCCAVLALLAIPAMTRIRAVR